MVKDLELITASSSSEKKVKDVSIQVLPPSWDVSIAAPGVPPQPVPIAQTTFGEGELIPMQGVKYVASSGSTHVIPPSVVE